MNGKQMFEKHYGRLAKEGMLKALILGLIVGFAVNFVIAFVTWFTPFNGLWVAIGGGVVTAAVSTPLFYYKLFRPTAKGIARRIDKLGLEERLITMAELENDPSYIAMRQREDAKEKLSGVSGSAIKFRISKPAVAAAAILAVLGVSMTTVTSLSAEGKVPTGDDFVDNIIPPEPPVIIEIYYVVEEGGYIEGDAEQIVYYGEDALPVLAVADDGWMFVGWDDEYEDPSRQDLALTENLTVTALFEEVDESDDGDDSEDDEEEDSDQASDEPSEEEQDQQNPDQSEPQNPDQNGDGADRYQNNNQILDGETYYRDRYKEFYEQAMEKLANGEELSDLERAIIEAYWDIIE